MNKIRGLDAIRFVCAFWVVLGHYGVPVPFGSQGGPLTTRMFDTLMHNLFFGPPAVIIFFVISGFCIHYPFHKGAKPSWPEYFLRRYIRIGIPLIAAKLFVHFAGPFQNMLEDAVLWSLYAELIYYTIYPLLRWLRSKMNWMPILAVSVVVSTTLIILQPGIPSVQGFGYGLAWAVGLPCWLLGCMLAEGADHLPKAAPGGMAFWRTSVVVASILCGSLRFHSLVSYSYTTTAFGILVYFWLCREITNARFCKPWSFLESAGKWSYSLYLCHHPAQFLYNLLHFHLNAPWLNWLAQIIFALVVSYLFFMAVERPSHWLARQAKIIRSASGPPPITAAEGSSAVAGSADPPQRSM